MIIQKAVNQTAQAAQTAQPVQTVSSNVVATAKPGPTLVSVGESAPSASSQVSPETLRNAVSVINQVMRQSNSSLQFSVDGDSNKPIVRLVDSKTGELIRQIPSDETLAISRSIDEVMQRQGLLYKQVV